MPLLRSRFNRLTFACLALAGSVILSVGIYVGALHASGNFHEVMPGELYRSGQLTPEKLAQKIAEHQIRTVLNLRGKNPGEAWYDAEVAATEQAGAKHLDFRMKASKI